MVKILNSENFNDFINKDLVLVDFYASWCGPCKMLAPNVEKVDEEGLIECGKLNIDEALDIAMSYNIQAVPYLGIFKNGKMVDKSIGYVDLAELKEFINKNI